MHLHLKGVLTDSKEIFDSVLGPLSDVSEIIKGELKDFEDENGEQLDKMKTFIYTLLRHFDPFRASSPILAPYKLLIEVSIAHLTSCIKKTTLTYLRLDYHILFILLPAAYPNHCQ